MRWDRVPTEKRRFPPKKRPLCFVINVSLILPVFIILTSYANKESLNFNEHVTKGPQLIS